MNFLKSEWRYCNPSRNANVTNENKSADLVNFDLKIGCHGNVPWAVDKRGQISNLRSHTCHTVKMWWKLVQ